MTQIQTQIPELIEQRRFSGVENVYGKAALERFRAAHVCVIGLGGVGSWAVEALARSAIGRLTLIDLDNIAVSNINRQIHALDDTIGVPKVEAMRARIASINPQCRVDLVEDFITAENLGDRVSCEYNHVIDCIDNFRVKAALAHHCKRNKIKLVITGGAGGQLDPRQIRIADLSRTEHDPLLSKVRKLLRQDYGFSRNLKRRFDIPCIYSHEQLAWPGGNGETTADKSTSPSTTGLNCETGLGSAVTVTASFGLFAASHVLRML